MRKPPRSAPQLLSIPNREAVIAAFKRAATYPMDLIAIELETHQSQMLGNGYKLVAFIRQDALNNQHIIPGDTPPTERRLIGAAEVMAQSMSNTLRKKYGAQNGRGGVERSVQFG